MTPREALYSEVDQTLSAGERLWSDMVRRVIWELEEPDRPRDTYATIADERETGPAALLARLRETGNPFGAALRRLRRALAEGDYDAAFLCITQPVDEVSDLKHFGIYIFALDAFVPIRERLVELWLQSADVEG
ncbi:hypothetical protein GCM10011360_08280 [Primorskyibacter flagellatus]|uniref:Uncharacterized protein n=1 Tax=Primorskyibacter flagellatus TaxID=1387277 RepID=A0A917A2G3_9RHOB|nr:hypothetical protein [Primorskyibacter flagellatus]GGE22134.1 hypothetical protein GCM10011360_08280 [Primorskyibacter flagellatus]